MTNYEEAKENVKAMIDNAIKHKDPLALGYYNGEVDITQGISFCYLADTFYLNKRQYEALINYSQKYTEKQIKKGALLCI